MSCSRCKHQNRSKLELPCLECTQNRAIDYFKPMTNADRIRNMTDEELAKFFHRFGIDCECCIHNMITVEGSEFCDGECKSGILKWLQAEVKEGDEQ